VCLRQASLLQASRVTPLHAAQVCWTYSPTPEVWALKVFLPLIAEQFLDVLTYERRLVVAGRFQGINPRWRSSEQVLDTIIGCRRYFFCLFATGNLAPRTNRFNRLSMLITDQALFIVDPTVGAIFLEKAI